MGTSGETVAEGDVAVAEVAMVLAEVPVFFVREEVVVADVPAVYVGDRRRGTRRQSETPGCFDPRPPRYR